MADTGAREAADTAAAALNSDPHVGLRAVAALRRLTERLEALQVAGARGQGWSWDEIGAALGVSRQAVHKKHARKVGAKTTAPRDPGAKQNPSTKGKR